MHKSVAITVTGIDTVGQSFRSGHDPHHPSPSAMTRQGEKQTTPKTGRGGS